MTPRARHGFVLGKFMPLHRGHELLVRFAQNYCEHVTVLVCSLPDEPIAGTLRFEWMRELFPTLNVVHITDVLPQTPGEHPDFWALWRAVALRGSSSIAHPIDTVFASEPYGVRLAAELDATYVPVDPDRTMVSISGTEVRQAPLAHWHFLPAPVRAHYLRRVCLFGPESTGKSTLARDLAAHFDTAFVSEHARAWLAPKAGRFDLDDIERIARGQIAAEDAMAHNANRVLFVDTDALTTTVWSDFTFGSCPEWIRALARERRYDLTLLLDVDVPWVDDGERTLEHRRAEFFAHCRAALDAHGRPYEVLSGTFAARKARAIALVDTLLRRERAP